MKKSMGRHSDETAVVVIMHKKDLSHYESISLSQCLKIFRKWPIHIAKPVSMDISGFSLDVPNLQIENFTDLSFSSIGEYSRLLLSTSFYKRFLAYKYILIYQLDAFVFSDQLKYWCDLDYDYLGAPWFGKFSSQENQGDFIGVGNGGFSLRKISSHLKVLNTFSFITPMRDNLKSRFASENSTRRRLQNAAGLILDYTVRNNTHRFFNNYAGHEDQFWGLSVAKKMKWFKVPDLDKAAAFAFEMQPHRLLILNNDQLPFGCHAWWKYDLEFWKPHIEQFGYKL
jgi:Protein of unknown function (DUF5672)